jgi:hypothetical protein
MKWTGKTLPLLLICFSTISMSYKTPYQNITEDLHFMAAVAGKPVDIASQPPGSASKAPSFVLEDQYGRTHGYKFPREKVSLLAFGDRQGAEQIESWIRPIYQRYEKRIDIFGVADVSAVPPFLRGLVRGAFQNKLDYPVMLDWSGEVSKSYAYRSGKANIFLVDRRGQIVLIKTGAATATDLDHIYQKLDKLLQTG